MSSCTCSCSTCMKHKTSDQCKNLCFNQVLSPPLLSVTPIKGPLAKLHACMNIIHLTMKIQKQKHVQ